MARRKFVWYVGRRKAKLTEVVRAQVNPPLPPQFVDQPGWRPRWPRLRLRRATVVQPPWPQAPANSNQPVYPWMPIRQSGWHPRWPQARLRRGHPVEPPWPQAQAAAPPTLPLGSPRQAGRRFLVPRRRRPVEAVSLAAGPPPLTLRPRPRIVCVRRGRLVQPPWPQVVAQPSVWRPGQVAARRRTPAILARRGQFIEPVWPFIPPPELVYATGTATHAQASTGPVALSSASGTTHHELTDPTPATITAASGTVTHQSASSGEGQVK